jgi:YVTN family beta-propeller protein
MASLPSAASLQSRKTAVKALSPRPALLLLGLILSSLTLSVRSVPADVKPADPIRFKSPLGLVVDQKGERAYVALHTADAVAVVDLKGGKVVREIPVGKGPYDVALAGKTLYVTCEADDNLAVVDLEGLAVRRRIPTGQAPRGLAVSADGSLIATACHDEGTVRWRDGETGSWHTIPLNAWPDRLAMQRDKPENEQWPAIKRGRKTRTPSASTEGRPLLVLSGPGGLELVHSVRTNLDKAGPAILLSNLNQASSNVRGLTGMAFGGGVFVHQLPKTHLPTTQVAQGWVFTNALTFQLWEEAAKPVTFVFDEPTQNYADPSDIAVSDDRPVYVASAAADTVLVLDSSRVRKLVMPRLGYHMPGDDVPYTEDFAASRRYITARLPTGANPRRLGHSGDGKTLVVSNYLGDSLTVIDAEHSRVVRQIPLGSPPPDAARRGEILFNSGKMTFQGQFTCASCHPNGDQDGLTWDLTRDGIGNFKNTKSLLGVRDTAPYGWQGTSPDLADRVRGTLRTLHRHEPTGTEVEDIVAYLQSLPPPRPLPQKEADKPAIARGQALFQGKGRCTACHHRVAFDDDKTHDVGTRGVGDTQDAFDTPALRGVARTAPYLHDGRANTLEEVFTKYNPEQRHGAAHKLSKVELADLIAYLKSL